MEEKEAYQRVKNYMEVPKTSFANPEIPFLHNQTSSEVETPPYNLVIFLQESLGAEFVDCLGGMSLTPELDKLPHEGMLFTHLYSTGPHSIRDVEAVVTFFYPLLQKVLLNWEILKETFSHLPIWILNQFYLRG